MIKHTHRVHALRHSKRRAHVVLMVRSEYPFFRGWLTVNELSQSPRTLRALPFRHRRYTSFRAPNHLSTMFILWRGPKQTRYWRWELRTRARPQDPSRRRTRLLCSIQSVLSTPHSSRRTARTTLCGRRTEIHGWNRVTSAFSSSLPTDFPSLRARPSRRSSQTISPGKVSSWRHRGL